MRAVITRSALEDSLGFRCAQFVVRRLLDRSGVLNVASGRVATWQDARTGDLVYEAYFDSAEWTGR